MFERFTTDARQVVVGAQLEARALGHDWIGTEHLLLAVLARSATPLAATLARVGVTHADVRAWVLDEIGSLPDTAAADDGALRELGIDLHQVRSRVEERFGPGALDDASLPRRRRWRRSRRSSRHLRFTTPAKTALELALRESMSLRSGEITSEHIVLGLLRGGGLAFRAVTARGVSSQDVRQAVLDRFGRAA